jgi:hypothetical protein
MWPVSKSLVTTKAAVRTATTWDIWANSCKSRVILGNGGCVNSGTASEEYEYK